MEWLDPGIRKVTFTFYFRRAMVQPCICNLIDQYFSNLSPSIIPITTLIIFLRRNGPRRKMSGFCTWQSWCQPSGGPLHPSLAVPPLNAWSATRSCWTMLSSKRDWNSVWQELRATLDRARMMSAVSALARLTPIQRQSLPDPIQWTWTKMVYHSSVSWMLNR